MGKRVRAIYPPLRAPDGSAFIKCELCGVSVPIALADMHDCTELDLKKRVKIESKSIEIQERSDKKLLTIQKKSNEDLSIDLHDQPRSPFCFFMEIFSKDCEGDVLIKVYERGFEAWQKMSIEERSPYITRAEIVDELYQEKLSYEIDEIPEVADDEANSPSTIFSQRYEDSSGSDYYGYYESD